MIVLAACIASPIAAPAVAQSGSAEVTVRFNPPLGRVVRYRSTKGRFIKGVTQSPPLTIVHEWRFERDGDGYLAYWRVDPAGMDALIPDPQMRALMIPTIAPFTDTPIAFEMDAGGNFVRVRDWDAIRKRLSTTMSGTITATKALPEQQGKVLRMLLEATLRRYLDQKAETAPQVLLDDFTNIFNLDEVRMRIGESVQTDLDAPVPLLGGTVKMHTKVTMVSRDNAGRVTIDQDSHYDPEAMARLVNRFAKSMVGDTPLPADGLKELDELKAIDIVTTVRSIYDEATGLPYLVDRKSSPRTDPTSYQARKIERID